LHGHDGGYRETALIRPIIFALVLSSTYCLSAAKNGSGDAPAVTDANGASEDGSPGEDRKDEFSYLEETHGARAVQWVKQQNDRTYAALKTDARYPQYYATALAAQEEESKSNGAYHTVIHNGWVYQLLENGAHPRGIWRRTTVDSYVSDRPRWRDVLDVDTISRAEGRNYSAPVLEMQPHGQHCMVVLTVGGSPYASYREFDVQSRQFVRGGFELPSSAAVKWANDNVLLVSTDFGPGSTEENGSALEVRRWVRGQALSHAKTIFRAAQAPPTSTYVVPFSIDNEFGTPNHPTTLVQVNHGNFHHETWIGSSESNFVRLPLPDSASMVGVFRGELIFRIDQDWSVADRTWPAGSYLSVPLDKATRGMIEIHPIRLQGPREALGYVSVTKTGVLMSMTRSVIGELWGYLFDGQAWVGRRLPMPDGGSIYGEVITDPYDDVAFANFMSLVTPLTPYVVRAEGGARRLGKYSSEDNRSGYATEHLEATSADGASIPYFVAFPKGFRHDSPAPTLLYGYGAYGAGTTLDYDATRARLWLDRGGIYVVAAIRGNGDFGPSWHVVRENRHLTYEDFVAVARDLIHRGITSPARLGIIGHSAGGTLAAVMITQYPELFHAAVLEAPNTDLLRGDLWQGGESVHAGEWGSMSIPAERAFMERTSPFQNVPRNAPFPDPFILTSTTDDQVPRALPRRFAAKLESLGLPYLFLETAEGGHGLAVTPQEHAEVDGMIYIYLAQRLMDADVPK
jgi:prolyl oligopeptidase